MVEVERVYEGVREVVVQPKVSPYAVCACLLLILKSRNQSGEATSDCKRITPKVAHLHFKVGIIYRRIPVASTCMNGHS
jgi:hypothetical protein